VTVLKTKLIKLTKNVYLFFISISKKKPYTVGGGLLGILALILAFNLLDRENEMTLQELQQLAKQTAERHGVDSSLVFAIIKQESGWKPDIISRAGAIGLMQIMPSTGEWACDLTREELFDPHKNLDCGVRYFRQQLKRFGNVKLALCAYNAGPGNVKHGRCPRFKETTQYVHNILSMWNK
jgi:membrane-bound lytic murein transglycosylase MltF